jgi:hypothetical protein
MVPQDGTPVQTGAALDVKMGTRTRITSLTVSAVLLRDAKVPRGCEITGYIQELPQ